MKKQLTIFSVLLAIATTATAQNYGNDTRNATGGYTTYGNVALNPNSVATTNDQNQEERDENYLDENYGYAHPSGVYGDFEPMETDNNLIDYDY